MFIGINEYMISVILLHGVSSIKFDIYIVILSGYSSRGGSKQYRG